MNLREITTRLMDSLDNKGAGVKEPRWLISAEISPKMPFTNSQLQPSIGAFSSSSLVGPAPSGVSKNSGDFGYLNSYREDLQIVNSKLSGEKGIQVANLVVNIPRDGNSVLFFNQFINKAVIKKIILIEVIQNHDNLAVRQQLTYKTCRIENFVNLMDSVELSINYNERSDVFSVYENGANTGQIVGTNIS